MEITIVYKLIIAAVLGMIIGIERELRKKPLGLKTSIVISVISCLLTIVSIESSQVFNKGEHITMDPLRLAAQIISGVGFLGAGVILRRNNDVISGLTTAALVWGAAGMGIATGAGFYKEAFFSLGLVLLSVEVLPLVIKAWGPNSLREKQLKVKMTIASDSRITAILKEIKALDVKKIRNVRVEDLKEGHHQMEIRIVVDEKRYTTDVYSDIRKLEDVMSVKVENI